MKSKFQPESYYVLAAFAAYSLVNDLDKDQRDSIASIFTGRSIHAPFLHGQTSHFMPFEIPPDAAEIVRLVEETLRDDAQVARLALPATAALGAIALYAATTANDMRVLVPALSNILFVTAKALVDLQRSDALAILCTIMISVTNRGLPRQIARHGFYALCFVLSIKLSESIASRLLDDADFAMAASPPPADIGSELDTHKSMYILTTECDFVGFGQEAIHKYLLKQSAANQVMMSMIRINYGDL